MKNNTSPPNRRPVRSDGRIVATDCICSSERKGEKKKIRTTMVGLNGGRSSRLYSFFQSMSLKNGCRLSSSASSALLPKRCFGSRSKS